MKYRNIWKYILVVAVLALIIADCVYNPPGAHDSHETIPATEPQELLPSETEPPVLTGPDVTVDGCSLESGSLLFGDEVHVNALEFLAALDCDFPVGEMDFQNGTRLYLDQLWVPLKEICAVGNISLYEDPEMSMLYCTSNILIGEIPGNIRVPVLMYHAVDSQVWGHRELFVSPEVMEQHIRFLLDNGYDPIFFEDLPNLARYDKPVILTFDDGYRNNYTELYPLLQKYQVKATIFIVTSSIGNRETSMTVEQVKELSDSGLVSVQSHTVNHRVLKELPPEEQWMELEQSKLFVTRMTGREPFAISYPTGVYDENTLQHVKELYQFGVVVLSGDFITGTNPWTIQRYNVRNTTTLYELSRMVSDAGKSG